MDLEEAKTTLEAAGYVVIKKGSYYAARERLRCANALLACEKEHGERMEAWGQRAWASERILRDRLERVVAIAIEHGMTYEDFT